MTNTEEHSPSLEDLQASLMRLNKIGISATPTDTLESMLANVDDGLLDLAQQAAKLEEEAKQLFQAGDVGVYKRVRERSRLLASEAEELEGLRERVHYAIEFNYLNAKLAKFVGGSWMVNAIQAFIMLLIFFVLGLLALIPLLRINGATLRSAIGIWFQITNRSQRHGPESLKRMDCKMLSMKNSYNTNGRIGLHPSRSFGSMRFVVRSSCWSF